MVEHAEIRNRLQAIGGHVDAASERVKFPRNVVEDQIAAAPKSARRDGQPEVTLGCSVYQCLYVDPNDDRLKPFDEDSLARYYALAESLPEVDNGNLLGLPYVPEGMTARQLPLAERFYAWKYGANPSGSIQLTEMCQPILEMLEIHASFQGKTAKDIFNAGGFIVSPLRLARPECEQIVFFAERGLHMWVGHLPTQGGTAPVTLAGTLVLALAEQLFIFLLDRALWGGCAAEFGWDGLDHRHASRRVMLWPSREAACQYGVRGYRRLLRLLVLGTHRHNRCTPAIL